MPSSASEGVLGTIEAHAERLRRLGPCVLAALLTACTGAAPHRPSPTQPATPQELPGSLTLVGHWVHLIDVTDEPSPKMVSEYRVTPYNEEAYCDEVSGERNVGSSFYSHNPTVTKHLALVTWHSAGLQLFSTSDPARPTQLAEFVPEPLDAVGTEDPALSSGPDQVVMWSYPMA